MNIWGMIQQSLEEINDRNTFVLEFNRFAKRMFSEGVTDVLYQSSVSGKKSYHSPKIQSSDKLLLLRHLPSA